MRRNKEVVGWQGDRRRKKLERKIIIYSILITVVLNIYVTYVMHLPMTVLLL